MKYILLSCLFTVLLFGCEQKTNETANILPTDSLKEEQFQGTWIKKSKEGFTLIDVEDSMHVYFYNYYDRPTEGDTTASDNYYYSKDIGRMGFFDSTTIWIAVYGVRLDYRIDGDTLIEFDKMGDQEKFIKVYTNKQKEDRKVNKK